MEKGGGGKFVFLSEINEAIDLKSPSEVIYFDFRKAFDSVPHEEFIYKQCNIGTADLLWLWF